MLCCTVLCYELPDKSLGEGHNTLAAHDKNDSGEKEGEGGRERGNGVRRESGRQRR